MVAILDVLLKTHTLKNRLTLIMLLTVFVMYSGKNQPTVFYGIAGPQKKVEKDE